MLVVGDVLVCRATFLSGICRARCNWIDVCLDIWTCMIQCYTVHRTITNDDYDFFSRCRIAWRSSQHRSLSYLWAGRFDLISVSESSLGTTALKYFEKFVAVRVTSHARLFVCRMSQHRGLRGKGVGAPSMSRTIASTSLRSDCPSNSMSAALGAVRSRPSSSRAQVRRLL